MEVMKALSGQRFTSISKKGMQPLSSNSMVNFMLWRQLIYCKNWEDKISCENSFRRTTSQKAGLSPPCVLFFSKRSYWYFLTSLPRWYVLVFSWSLLHQFLSICSTLLHQNGQVLTHGTQNLFLHRGTTGLFDLYWKNASSLQKITLTSFNFLVELKKENRCKIKATSIFVLRHAYPDVNPCSWFIQW